MPSQGFEMIKKIGWLLLVILGILPLLGLGNYPLHLLIVALLWSYIYTSWSIMGRLGLVSFGHSAFIGVGAYSVVMMWNLFGWSPWVGALVGIAVSLVIAFLIGWPCFRFKIVGNYFAMVTLALSEIVRLVIVAMRVRRGSAVLAHKFNQRRYTTGNKKIQTRSTKCQNKPPTSMRLINCSGFDFHILAPGKAK